MVILLNLSTLSFKSFFPLFFFFTKSEEADEDENLKNNLKMRDER